MVVRIEKELCNPVSVNGYAEVPGPLYHIYKVHDDGTKEFVKTVEKDIREAAREAQRVIDINVLEVAYKKNPNAFKSTLPAPTVWVDPIPDDQPFVLHEGNEEKKVAWKDIKELYEQPKKNKVDEIKEDVFKVRSGVYAIDDNGVAYSKEAVKNAVDEFNKNCQPATECSKHYF